METVNRELIQAWLNLQCSMVAGVTRAAVLLGSRPAAVWPKGSSVPASLTLTAQRAALERCEVIDSVAMAVGVEVGQPSDIVACPILVDGRLFGVVSLEMSARAESKQRAALQVLTWGISWLELLVRDWSASAAGRLGLVVETCSPIASRAGDLERHACFLMVDFGFRSCITNRQSIVLCALQSRFALITTKRATELYSD